MTPPFAAPLSASNKPDAVNASKLFQGLGGLFPVTADILDLYEFQVEGINCAGPMAPPYPYHARFDTGCLSGSRPSSAINVLNIG